MSEIVDKEKTKSYTCTIYLKNGNTVTTTTTDPDSLSQSLIGFMDNFYKRSLSRKPVSVIKLIGEPNIWIPLDNINFFSIVAKHAEKD